MSWLDPVTMGAATALVVVVCGVLYLVDTRYRRGNAAAGLWSVAFISGILTTLSYLVWTAVDDGWSAGMVGNAALVLTIGMLWLGCLRFNGRLSPWAAVVVGGSVLLTVLVQLVAGAAGGPWGGAWAQFVSVAVLAALGAVASRRGRMATFPAASWLTVVLAAVSLFYTARIVALVVSGAQSTVFATWFGTPSASVLTIVLTITAVVAMMVLRVQEPARGHTTSRAALIPAAEGYLDAEAFTLALTAAIGRASTAGKEAAVVAVRLAGLEEIAAVFGGHHVRQLTERGRTLILPGVPLEAFLTTEQECTLVALPDATDREALRLGNRLSALLTVELAEAEAQILPTIGIGVATSMHRPDAAALVAAARRAAEASIRTLDGAAHLADAPEPPSEDGQAVSR